jgi:transposase-like protein
MPRGRKTSVTIRLTPAQHQTLLAWQRATTIAAGLARRARIILLLADGRTITDIATAVGVSRRFVYKWVHRFGQDGLEGLHERSRGPHRPRRPLPPALGEPDDMEVG